jgi:hypothetical protein
MLGLAVGVAASVAIGLIPLLSRKPPDHLVTDEQLVIPQVAIAKPEGAVGRGSPLAQESLSQTSRTDSHPDRVDAPSTDAVASRANQEEALPSIPRTAIGAADSDRTTDEGVLAGVRKLLDHPELRHVFLITDRVSGGDPARIAGLIDQSARSDYYSMTIAQGIVVDPDHPGQATVYAIAIDESELGKFRSRLQAAYGERNVEVEPKAEVLAQLSEIGQVESHAPPAIGEIVIPRSDVAIKVNPAEPAATAESIRLVDGSIPGTRQAAGPSSTRIRNRRLTNTPPITDRQIRGDTGTAGTAEDHPGSSESSERSDRDRPNKSASREIVVLVWIRPPSSG